MRSSASNDLLNAENNSRTSGMPLALVKAMCVSLTLNKGLNKPTLIDNTIERKKEENLRQILKDKNANNNNYNFFLKRMITHFRECATFCSITLIPLSAPPYYQHYDRTLPGGLQRLGRRRDLYDVGDAS